MPAPQKTPSLYHSPVATPVGPATVAYGPLGVIALALTTDPTGLRAEVEARTATTPRSRDSLPEDLATGIRAVLEGRAPATELDYDLRGLSELTTRVLGVVARIPPGETRSYAWVARKVGQPAAVRAVGSAVGRNPLPLLIGCHRVVRSDGSLGGFSLGLGLKRRLLGMEATAA